MDQSLVSSTSAYKTGWRNTREDTNTRGKAKPMVKAEGIWLHIHDPYSSRPLGHIKYGLIRTYCFFLHL